MKRVITAIATLAIVLALTGCSSLYNSTPEFAAAYDAHGKTYHLAAQVRKAERVSMADKVRKGERFLANCDTYSRTIADLLIEDHGADPAEVWLVQVTGRSKGMWITRNSRRVEMPVDIHQVVVWKGIVIDNRWKPVLTLDDLEWEYDFLRKKNMKDQKWIAW